MRSLDKATTAEELNHFVNTTTSGARRFLSQPKLDGSALSLGIEWGGLSERPHAEAVSAANVSPTAGRQRSPHSVARRRARREGCDAAGRV